ncbi:UNVERIFIED_CONTAM: hypothetical protein H355_006752 [Colinus virginianus]|nr:hypothetical protein H355_006752 [Colinus virginianus]
MGRWRPVATRQRGSGAGPTAAGDSGAPQSLPLKCKPCGRSPRCPLRSDSGACHTVQSAAGRGQDMHGISCLLSGLAFILSTTSTDGFARVGRRTCAAEPRSRTAAHTESHVQPVYLPYLTTCQGHRLCSTYRTVYKVAYRQVYKQVPQPVASCCPGWSRTSSYELSCNTGPSNEMKEEMKDLKNRVEALEQKLQLVLAPFHNLMPSAPEDVGTDPISRLSHSLQQLDRIDSLSEQISFLEERLETCSCKNEL